MNRLKQTCAGLCLAASTWALPAAAAYPEKPVRAIIPYPPGGTIDAMLRVLQDRFLQVLGQPMVIENKPGAAGVTGMQELARAPADGYTIGQSNSGIVITPVVQPSVGAFDMERDLTPITMQGVGPLVLFTHPRVPGEDVAAFIAYAKSRPDGLNYSSTGLGGAGHLTAVLLGQLTGTKLTHIPYRGNAPAMLAVLQGEVDFLISTVNDTALQSMQAKKLKIIGVTTRNATPVVPGVPPIAATVPGIDVPVWVAMMAPRNTPPDIIAALNRALVAGMNEPDIRKRYESYGFIAAPGAPAVVTEAIRKEMATWLPIIRAQNIRVQ